MKKPEAHAKFLLEILECVACRGFSTRDIRKIQEELEKRHEKLWEGWRQIHGEEEVLNGFRVRAKSEGTKYQTLVNQALREALKRPSLVDRVERLEKKLGV